MIFSMETSKSEVSLLERRWVLNYDLDRFVEFVPMSDCDQEYD